MNETFEGRLPTAREEDRFWALIESAWRSLGDEPAARRRALLRPDRSEADLYAVDPWLGRFLDRLRAASADLPAEELVALDRVAERKLYDIDREDIQEVTDGSDDGFLYARGFIVAMGREFYEAVVRDPAVAVLDGECEAMCYFFDSLHHERFGTYPDTGSGINRETGNNSAGWGTLD